MEKLILPWIQPIQGEISLYCTRLRNHPMIVNNRMKELELLEGCINGDRLAQKALYEKYCKAMYTVAYRITNDFETAQDVLQEGFVKVFKNIDRFRRESTLGAWIKTIIVRTALSHIRKEVKHESLEPYHTQDLIDWGNHLDTEYLEKAIQSLPEGYRAVFVLIEIEGYAHREVAKMLGISEGTSKSQLYYAKRKLRTTVQKLMDV